MKNISPKVWAGLITGLGIAIIGAGLTYLTPATFAFLGSWGPIAYTLVTLAGAQVAAFLKTDPARTGVTAKTETDIQSAVDDAAKTSLDIATKNAPEVVADAPKVLAAIDGVVGDVKSAE